MAYCTRLDDGGRGDGDSAASAEAFQRHDPRLAIDADDAGRDCCRHAAMVPERWAAVETPGSAKRSPAPVAKWYPIDVVHVAIAVIILDAVNRSTSPGLCHILAARSGWV